MENVGVDWIGAAIGAAAGVVGWAGSQLQGVGQSVVNGVVDAVQSLQPSPYEEWINAPVAESSAPVLDFRNPSNETSPTTSPAVIISQAGVQEAQTGISAPQGPNGPYETTYVPPQDPPADPQAPTAPGFIEVPEAYPPTTSDANVIMDWRIANPDYWPNPDNSPNFHFFPRFREQVGASLHKTVGQAIFYAVPRIEDGVIRWTARVQALVQGRVQKTWEFEAGNKPPENGEFALIYNGPNFSEDLLADPIPGSGTTIKRYALQETAAPPLIDGPPLFVDPAVNTNQFPTPNLNWPTLTETSGNVVVPVVPNINTPTVPQPLLPSNPTQTPVNNPIFQPQIGTNGLPILSPGAVPNTGQDVHVIDGLPVNSGGIRTSIAAVATEVGRIEQKASRALNKLDQQGGLLDRLPELILLLQGLADLFEQPLESKTYEIQGVCEEPLEDGRQPSTSVILPPEKWAERVISLGDMMPDLLQAHLGYKTPTCSASKPPLEGDWITTRWLSDEKMDHSERRLRKLFRYRSKSTRDLGQLSTYWESFVWRSGPVCVIHKGAWWGTPQVWAETAEEGKRVIRFAAAEAGLDPDQVGRWEVSGSRSPRYGMSGTMRIHVHKGFPWVASRDGANWPNYLAKEA